jgi:hypothetical protein
MKKRAFILCMLIICVGCASMPEKPVAPSEPIFYPSLPQRPRLQFLLSISGESDLGKKQSAFQEFLVGRPRDQLLGKPYDVAASKGKIYIMDRILPVYGFQKRISSMLRICRESRWWHLIKTTTF